LDLTVFESEQFVIGYYIFTVSASLLLVKETKNRVKDLKKGLESIKFAPIAYVVILAYVFFAYATIDTIPILNWSWLGYNIAFGPFAEQGFWGVLPFIPILVYMFLHINYVEEFYFRRSKKMVLVWALIHVAMGIKLHMALMLIPVGFLFKYIYDKKGLNHSFAMHFATNILVVLTLFFSFIS
jgi:hypothetical protein